MTLADALCTSSVNCAAGMSSSSGVEEMVGARVREEERRSHKHEAKTERASSPGNVCFEEVLHAAYEQRKSYSCLLVAHRNNCLPNTLHSHWAWLNLCNEP
ncbi:hypothetical protein AMECASPLE_030298 [Ameca splendens]|uniref:Uncharacterized protein n=1 Tax=Ameca splendens TaxID=208324 RepID=A0ABV0YI70_9TELE